MKRKEDNDNLLSQTNYWNMKLGIKHITEKTRYKKLCGYKLTKSDKEYLDGAYYITFSDWKEYMEEKLSVLNQEELFEYSKYIKLNLEKADVFEGLLSKYIFPLMIATISPLISEIFIEYVLNKENDFGNGYGAFIVKLIVCMIGFYFMLKYVMNYVLVDVEDGKVSYLFYKDIYELIISKLQQVDCSKRRKMTHLVS